MLALPNVLLNNMDKWDYDENGKMIPVKGASFEVIKAIKEMNQMEDEEQSDDVIINY